MNRNSVISLMLVLCWYFGLYAWFGLTSLPVDAAYGIRFAQREQLLKDAERLF